MIRTVVHFVDGNAFGGCEEVVLTLLAGLDRKHWRPILFHHGAAAMVLDKARDCGIECRWLPRITRHGLVRTMLQFRRELRAVEADVFHAHLNWPLAGRHQVRAARITGIPVVATCHLYSAIAGARGRVEHKLHAAIIDRYIAVSNEVERRLCVDLGVRGSKISVVQNGIQLTPADGVTGSRIREALTEGDKYSVVLTPARLHAQKGHVYLLEAAALVPDAVFVLAGDGPERARLERYAQKLGVAGRVRFLGHRLDVRQLLESCDVFVLPSLYEGLPLAVLEAMAAGKPVVATAIGGTNEIVEHGVTGLLVPPGEPEELAGAIHKLLSDRVLAGRLAESGRARAIEHFSAEAMVRGVARIYDEVLTAAR